MPSTSKKQHNFMAAVANNPKFAKKAGVSSVVGKEFLTADKGKTFKEGGTMKKMNPGMMAMMAKKKPMKMAGGGMPMGADGKPTFASDGVGKMAKGGKVTQLSKANGVATKGKTKGTMIKMAKGGKTC
jgi:hypothetical protein